MGDEYRGYAPDHYMSPYDVMRAYRKRDVDETQALYDLSRLGGTAANPGPDYERIDNPLNVYLFEDKAVIICNDGRVAEKLSGRNALQDH